MAGSYLHCIKSDFTLTEDLEDMIENGGDAYEAIEEMVYMINFLSGGDPEKIYKASEAYYKENYPYKEEDEDGFNKWLKHISLIRR